MQEVCKIWSEQLVLFAEGQEAAVNQFTTLNGELGLSRPTVYSVMAN